MQEVSYYLQQAEKAERLASPITDKAVEIELRARRKIIETSPTDLENGAVEIQHPERMLQKHPR
jgi:hypothetical protein